jgi:hypothetical protein
VVAVFVQTCLSLEVRIPDPVDCHKFYNRSDSDTTFSHVACADDLVFDVQDKICKPGDGDCKLVELVGLHNDVFSNILGFYCNSNTSFTYCTLDDMKIAVNVNCPEQTTCKWENHHPCVPLNQ